VRRRATAATIEALGTDTARDADTIHVAVASKSLRTLVGARLVDSRR
jgi:hypothetical protein